MRENNDLSIKTHCFYEQNRPQKKHYPIVFAWKTIG